VVLIEQKIAIIHACLAQAFFALIASISLFTSAEWRAGQSGLPAGDTKKAQQLGLLTVGLIYAQLILGALFRHTGTGLSLHILGAVAVFILTFLLLDHVRHYHATQRPLLRSGVILRRLLLLQVGLGLFTYVVKYVAPPGPLTPQAVLLATSHVIVGAFMLVTSVRFTLWAYRTGRRPQETSSRIFSEQVSV
jgi:cytochrome c oxidase assembly protein subunit 15